MAARQVNLPPSLAFLVSNFNSLVNIKLDNTNYLLWKTQVENIMNANGFLGYLDGTIDCPASEIRNSNGEMEENPAYALWKLIDSQLLSCLTSSLSMCTLPYVLGLRHSVQVWASLNSRYNTLSRTHVQELKDKLYTIKQTTTVEEYIDKIKDYAQKLEASGSPVSEDDLIFHTLRGLSRPFRGFKTASKN